MSDTGAESRCGNCGRVLPADDVHADGWCDECRARVIRRATLLGRAAGALAALLVGLAIFGWARPSSRFLMAWLVLVAAVHFAVYKLVRRVAFEMIRARGVPAPEE